MCALTRIHNKAWRHVINQKDLAPGIIILSPSYALGQVLVWHPSKDAHQLHRAPVQHLWASLAQIGCLRV